MSCLAVTFRLMLKVEETNSRAEHLELQDESLSQHLTGQLYVSENYSETHGVSKVNGPKVAKFLDR